MAHAAAVEASGGGIFAKMKGAERARGIRADDARTLTISHKRRKDRTMILTLIHVALGGAIGASLRYLVQLGTLRLFGSGFPYGTLAVNVAGSFAMGVLVVVLAEKAGMRLAPFVLTGMLGGFTTFSTFSLDAVTLWERGQSWMSLGYVGVSILFSLAALVVGLQLARSLI